MQPPSGSRSRGTREPDGSGTHQQKQESRAQYCTLACYPCNGCRCGRHRRHHGCMPRPAQQHPLLFFFEDTFFGEEAFLEDFFSFFAAGAASVAAAAVSAAGVVAASATAAAAGSAASAVVTAGAATAAGSGDGYATMDGAVWRVATGGAAAAE
mmetsp:Transcript_60835/g.121944  ORF Transcript_60835/g.121944 Transcript_60835/m.121944 type:complete len:154 (+) Transcript_60835:43-504(+)